MLIKQLDYVRQPNVFDVFLGKGFDQWTRVRRAHWGCVVVAGNKIPHYLLKQIAANLG
jgi:hypothetical protein